MSLFNVKKPENSASNLAGGRAFCPDSRTALVFAVLDTFLKDSFYEKGGVRLQRIRALAWENEPVFVAKLAVLARRDFHLRSVSHVLAGELAKMHAHGLKPGGLIMDTVTAVCERPDDMAEIISYLGKPIPKQVKRGIRHAMYKFSPYQLAKYKMEKRGLGLVDIFNLVHPKPLFASAEQKAAWQALIEGNLPAARTWESVLSASADKRAAWKSLVLEHGLGMMALVRNLRNIEKYCGDDADVVSEVTGILCTSEAVRNSKLLPFRFLTSYEMVSLPAFKSALSIAAELSLWNVPSFGDGITRIAIDTSTSMRSLLGHEGAIEKASVFAASLAKKNNVMLSLYAEKAVALSYNPSDSLLTIAEQMKKNGLGGGTNTSSALDAVTENIRLGGKADRVIIISDEESWMDGNRGVKEAFNRLRKESSCPVFFLDLEGYGTMDVIGEGAFHLCGWSEKLFQLMTLAEQGASVVDLVDSVEIPAFPYK